jgi:hypothetical protein
MMGNHRTSKIERIVHRIEEHVEEWRRQDAARHAEAEANRGQLWAEAAEREKLLAKAVSDEKSRGVSPEITKQQRVVFVVSSEEFARTLQCFSPERDRLVKVVPARESGGGMGMKGSWLVLETSQ